MNKGKCGRKCKDENILDERLCQQEREVESGNLVLVPTISTGLLSSQRSSKQLTADEVTVNAKVPL